MVERHPTVADQLRRWAAAQAGVGMGHLGTPGADEARPHNQGDKDKTTKTREHKITTLYFRLTLHSHGIGVLGAKHANASGRGH